MLKRMGLNGLRNELDLTINGLPAHSAQVVVNSPYGQRLSRVTVIYFGPRAIIISSATKDVGGINRFDNVFLAPHNANSSPFYWEKVHENSVRMLLKGLDLE